MGDKVQTGFWPRLFRRASGERRTGETRWVQRPHADSSASAATAVADDDGARLGADSAKYSADVVDSAKHRKLRRRATGKQPTQHESLGQQYEHPGQQYEHPGRQHENPGRQLQAESVHEARAGVERRAAGDRAARVYSGTTLGIGQGHEDGAFWRQHDRRVGQGSAQAPAREILDAMVDDMGAQLGAWRVAGGQGTFNDVLGNASAVHPIVLAFVRAHVERGVVCLGPEHIWLAVLQGLGAVLRAEGADAERAEDIGKSEDTEMAEDAEGAEESDDAGSLDAGALWRALRASSRVPRSSRARGSGHEVRLFGGNVHARHTLHAGRGAAPLAMAAAAAGSREPRLVDYGRIAVGGRLVAWQPRRRRTNPQWAAAMGAAHLGVRGMQLGGSLQAWSALCVLARQLKDAYTGRLGSGVDWWLHRVHLLARDLADYFAAQDNGAVPRAWREWLALALFDGHSGGARGSRLDGWLAALFAVDAGGAPVHARHAWAVEWERVPSGVDLLRAALPAGTVNMYSGFVGVQQLRRAEPACDGGSTLAGSREELAGSQEELAGSQKELAGSQRELAFAPLVGWAVDG